MKVEYDKEAKAIYITFIDVPYGGVDHTEELVAATVMVDYSRTGNICGIEILGVNSLKLL